MNKRLIISSLLIVAIIAAGYFLFKKKQVELIVIDPITKNPVEQQVVKLVDGRQCYTYSHDATDTEPYATTEFIDINISGSVVTGTKKGTQRGPDMTNGYTGVIEGVLENNKIKSIFSYTIEGSKNKEEELYQAGLTGIEKLRYPLQEEKGILVPDTTKEFKVLKYARVGCEGSN